jgi:ABC-type glycerol-3-phosphate transport system substrate-binding protein
MGISRRSLSASVGALGASFAAAVLAGCGAGAQSGGGGELGKSSQPATVRVVHRTEKYLADRGAKFTQQHPNVTVDFMSGIQDEKLMALVAAGDLGDLVWTSSSTGTLFELIVAGHFENLEPYVSADKYDLKQHFPRCIEVARVVDGKLRGLPNLIHPSFMGLFYNQTVIEEAGARVPALTSTWEDVIDVARRVQQRRPDVAGLATGTGYSQLTVFVRNYGGELLDPPILGKKPAVDKAPAKAALQFLVDLRHKHKVNPLPGAANDFRKGTLAMFTDSALRAIYNDEVKDKFKMEATLIPMGPGKKRGSQGHSDTWGINSKSRVKDASWQLLRFFVSKEQGIEMFPETRVPGARFDSWAAMANQPMFKVFKDFMENPGPEQLAIPYNFRMQELTTTVGRAMEPLWTGEMGVDQAVNAVVGPMQQILDRPRLGA